MLPNDFDPATDFQLADIFDDSPQSLALKQNAVYAAFRSQPTVKRLFVNGGAIRREDWRFAYAERQSKKKEAK